MKGTTIAFVSVAASVGLMLVPMSTVAADGGNIPAAASLSEPFSDWNVKIGPENDNDQVLTVSFDSPLLKRRSTNTVFLPDNYDGAKALPTLYSLHGTIVAALHDLPAQDLIGSVEPLVDQISQGGGKLQTDTFHYDKYLSEANFLVVALDTHPEETVFKNSMWVDGRDDLIPNVRPATAETLPAESHFMREVVPLMEELFGTRTDRAGRGVIGYSAGGTGALLQAFRHPDRFSVMVAMSPGADILDDPMVFNSFTRPVGYFRDQGYGDPLTDEIWYRNFNPPELASNAAGTGMNVVMATGDSCLTLEAMESQTCMKFPAVTNPFALYVEKAVSSSAELASKRFTQAGLDHTYHRVHGVHGAINEPVYGSLVDSINASFASRNEGPARFTYRTVDSNFAVWNYDVTIDRPNDEFASLSARRDGRSFKLAGTGTAKVTTPSTFKRNQDLVAVITNGDGISDRVAVSADDKGAVTLTVPLGEPRQLDEHRVPAGLDGTVFPSPITTVQLEDRSR